MDEERQHIVTHAKQELRQRWAPMPIPHRLLTRCWHLLPAEKWSLPQSKSNAREKKPKPKPKAKPPSLPRWHGVDEANESKGASS